MNIFNRLLADGEKAAQETSRRARYAARGEDQGATWRSRLGIFAASAMVGAGAAWLFDPARGRARRARLTDQAAAGVRRGIRGTERLASRVRSEVAGKVAAARHAGREGDPFPDDVTLAARVQTELFRDSAVPKGSLNVNVERGIVVLRGEVPDEAMRTELAEKVEGMSGVWSVRNLLHLPGERAPQEAMGAAAS